MTEWVGTLAGRGRRLVATLIDAVLVPSVTLFLVMITEVAEQADDYQDMTWVLHIFLLAVVSYLILNGYLLLKRGQTIGKWLLKVAIVSQGTGERAPFWKLIGIRALFFPLLFLVIPPLVLLPILDHVFVFMKSRRCVHDYAAGTSVVRIATS